MTSVPTGGGTPETFTYGHDVHGSVSQLLSDTGTVKASYGYNAYGGSDAPTSDPQALTTGDPDAQAPINPYRYTGKRLDSGLATSPGSARRLPHGRAPLRPRHHPLPAAGPVPRRLGDLGLSVDPLIQNRYALAGGNPVSYVE